MGDVVTFNPKVPAHLQNSELSDVAKALIGSGPTGKRLSIRGGVFRLIVDGREIGKIDDRALDIVIVAANPNKSRTYYVGEYSDTEDAKPPVCWSEDGLVPDLKAAQPQAPRCMGCPMDVKGSGKGESKACRYSQRLAIVLANDMGGNVLQLSLPATSIFGDGEGGRFPLQAYAKHLAAASPRAISPNEIVTRMSFDTDAAVPKLFFQPVRYLDGDEYATCTAQSKTEDAQRAITFTVSQQDKVPGAHGSGDKPTRPAEDNADAEDDKPKAKATPKPKAKEAAKETPEEAPAPKVRAPEPKAPAVGKTAIDGILDDWSDDD